VTDSHIKPLRLESDAPGRRPVHLRQVVRDSDGNVVKDEIVQLVYSVDDEPGPTLENSPASR
jgi:hypothetical protein